MMKADIDLVRGQLEIRSPLVNKAYDRIAKKAEESQANYWFGLFLGAGWIATLTIIVWPQIMEIVNKW